MKVNLISYTPDAMDIMLFTRSTRLTMSPEGLAEVKAWSEEKKRKELEHMLHTIQSSWAFIDYVFAIQDVTRAFTHQLVRHSVGTAFAQQSMRTVDMSKFTYETGPSISDPDPTAHGERNPNHEKESLYDSIMNNIRWHYKELAKAGADIQDARGILPTNIHTNIVFKANLRTLHDMGLKRLCVKTQGEFQEVFKRIREEVIAVHPWAERFIRVHCAFHGDCAFHDFPVEKCPIKKFAYNKATGLAYEHQPSFPFSIEAMQAVWERHQNAGTFTTQTEVAK